MFFKRFSFLSAIPAATVALSVLPQTASASAWGVLTDLMGCTDAMGNNAFVTGRMSAACIPIFIGHLITFVFGFVGTLFVLNVMYAGYMMVMAPITESDKGAAKERLKWSIVGLIVTTCVYLILDLFLFVILGS